MDYRRFLQQSQASPDERSVPVVGGHAWLPDRRVRVARPAEATPGAQPQTADGWWKVRVQGRAAELIAPAGHEAIAAAMASLPRGHGHLFSGAQGLALVDGEAGCRPVDLAPADSQPPLLAPLIVRHWPTGDLLLWEQLEWEGEEEEVARRALEDRQGLAAVKGIPASLRAAFAFTSVRAASRALNIPAQPGEVRRWVAEIADQGHPRAEAALRALAQERAMWAARSGRPRWQVVAATPAPDLETEVDEVLRVAGARPLGLRRLGEGTVEVRWMFQGQRLTSVVAERGLRVLDSGVCLSGEDDRLTLDSLPGVIREALHEDALVITRHQ